MQLAKAYDPKTAESRHYRRWESLGFFRPEINQNPHASKFSIVIPPPNVTGSLHIGHALQHTLMDVLVRRKRMLGCRTLWLPGTDHAGISVQRKVVEQLRKEEGKTPLEIGREEFIRRCWLWKEQYGNTIIEQMRREGASVDWSRHRFTMDESYSRAVRSVFCTLYNEGWIYRGWRIVNWCPRDRTVLSDLEVKEEVRPDGKLYYLKYPLVDDRGKTLTVATTRPETMLGDVAVAVNPSDDRYSDLIGKLIELPLAARQIPIIADEYVDPGFGTGAVKITPAHDLNDYEIGRRHDLAGILVMNHDGTMNSNAGRDFDGLDRFEARQEVIARFGELGLLEKIEDYELTVPVCERCKTIVEPILSEQWFVKMDGLRDLALVLMENEGLPRFWPEVPHKKVYTSWLENLKDWTISRQLWWGHRIPAWYDEAGNVYVAETESRASELALGKSLHQDPDVLDTWFSSALWAFATMGWDGEVVETEDLRTFVPTDALVTGRDIIFLWVSRMVMMTKKLIGCHPFNDVIVTGTVLGKDGKPMSKSRNNGVDPIEMFDKYGVDATRIYLASIATGADIRWNDLLIETYRNFANKIWNAARFCLLNSGGAVVDLGALLEPRSAADKWIISRFNRVAIAVGSALDKYQFHEAVQILYHFFWDDFCDWYIELVKDEITGEAENEETSILRCRIMTILEQSLRLLHPFMPYLTEEIWEKLPGVGPHLHNEAYRNAPASIMLSDYPKGNEQLIDERAEAEMQLVIELIKRIRNIRSEMNIKPGQRIPVFVIASDGQEQIFKANEAPILKLARAASLTVGRDFELPRASAKAVLAGGSEVVVPLEGLIDFTKERERLKTQLTKLENELTRISAQLENENFVLRAPAKKVGDLRKRKSELEQQQAMMRSNLAAIGE